MNKRWAWVKKDGSVADIRKMDKVELEGRIEYLTARQRDGFVMGQLKKALAKLVEKEAAAEPQVDVVTPADVTIAGMREYGLTWAEVAEKLGVSISTAKRRAQKELA